MVFNTKLLLFFHIVTIYHLLYLNLLIFNFFLNYFYTINFHHHLLTKYLNLNFKVFL